LINAKYLIIGLVKFYLFNFYMHSDDSLILSRNM